MSDVPTERTASATDTPDVVLHPWPRADARPVRGDRPVCLLLSPRGELGLSRTLLRTLQEELPQIRFTLSDEASLQLVWLCGTAEDTPDRLRALRSRHPSATLIVTGRDLPGAAEGELLAAGADVVLAWPVQVRRLREVLAERARA